jgi:hypothetical protein
MGGEFVAWVTNNLEVIRGRKLASGESDQMSLQSSQQFS